jgi:uncharacterized protein YdeI (YjbR/CyaY-like superfamily)
VHQFILIKIKNVLGLGAFKSYVSLWFFNGVFLKDEQKMLINAQEGVTKALRQWRFSNEEEIVRNCNIIKQYVFEAIEIEKQGKSIKPAKTKKVIFPLELKSELDNNYEFKRSFESFSLAKQREFAEHIAQAKKNETRISRLQKVISNVLSGEGLNDKYKKKQR